LTGAELLDRIHAAQSCAIPGCRCLKPGMTHCPSHADARPSLSLSLKGGVALVHCQAGCDQEDVIAALRENGLWPEATTSSAAPKRTIVKTYDYHGPVGGLVFQVVRFEPKDFRQRRPDGNGGWLWDMKGVKPILYRLPELLRAPRDQDVIIVEGEKDVDTAASLGLLSTCTPMGAGKSSKCDLSPLRGRGVVIIADNDKPGLKHAEDLRSALRGLATRITVTKLPAHDLTDYVTGGHTREHLESWIAMAQEDGRAEVAREPVRAPLDEVHAFLARFVSYPSEHAHVAHTLWIAHAHLMDVWESTPRIAFLSPEPASGKSRALEVTELLVPLPVEAVNVTAAYLFRKVGADVGRPTILYDEIDTVFGPRAKENEDIRGLLNAGHRRGAVAGRCVVHGKTVLTEEIPAYCAVALAGLGGLPDTILSRCVIVRMRRRAPDEPIEPFRRREVEMPGHTLRERLDTWARAVEGQIRGVWPEMPEGITDRDADVWEALLAVADAAGGEWPQRARRSAVALVADSKAGTPSLGILLLADLRTVFGDADALSTDTIITRLIDIEESPWGEVPGRRGEARRPLNARGLAQRLRSYEVKSKNVRVDGVVLKGYARDDLYDVWKRYLPSLEEPVGTPPYESATSATTLQTDVRSSPYRNGTEPESETADERSPWEVL
jgi:hypothetical protein